MNLIISIGNTTTTFEIDPDAGDFERDVTVKLDDAENTMTLAGLLDKFGVRKIPPSGPMAYLDIYQEDDPRRPELNDEYVVTAVSDFDDPYHGKCWPCEVRQKI